MTQTAPQPICSGVEVVLTDDGPEAFACLCRRCTGKAVVSASFIARPDRASTGFTSAMLAVIDEDAW